VRDGQVHPQFEGGRVRPLSPFDVIQRTPEYDLAAGDALADLGHIDPPKSFDATGASRYVSRLPP